MNILIPEHADTGAAQEVGTSRGEASTVSMEPCGSMMGKGSVARSLAATEGTPTEVPTEAELLDKDAPISASLAELGTAGSMDPVQLTFWRGLKAFMGPGFLVSMAYIDPGNLASDINQGVQAGYTLIWVTLWCTVLGFVMQMMGAKLGVATGRHLAEHAREAYPRFPRMVLWVLVELGVIACDMIEVIGGAVALNTLSNGAIPLWAGVLVTAFTAFGCLLLERAGMRLLEAVLVALILTMGGTFFYMFFTTKVDYLETLKGMVIPRLNGHTIPYAVGAVGAIIMPHNLYLHSALMMSRSDHIATMSVQRALRFVKVESAIALTLSVLINISIIAVFAGAFYNSLISSEVGLGNAGFELGNMFGSGFRIIWGVGLLAAANASTVTSTYAGQMIMDGYLNWKVSIWWRTLVVRLITLGPALLVAISLRSKDASFDTLTEWLNIVQSLVLPFVVIPLLLFTSSERIMGEHASRLWFTVVMCIFTAILIGMNGYLAVQFGLSELPDQDWAKFVFALICTVYLSFMAYLIAGVERSARWWASTKLFVKTRAQTLCARPEDMMEVHI